MMEDPLGGGPPSIVYEITEMVPPPSSTPSALVALMVPTKRSKGSKGKTVTAFILFSSEVRKDRMQSNPDCTFGDISRMVGSEWRNMTADEKQYWEEKASQANEENAIKYAEEQNQVSLTF